MNIDQLTQILSMSGYGTYVWGSFGITAFVLITLFISIKRRLNKAIRHNQEIKQHINQ